jgi:anionic cell wall polymer biosynthesis LytR-Cps2A-Psr (LCP) family protein
MRNGLEPPKARGCHNALPDDSEAEADILTWIQHQAEKSQPSTTYENRTDILILVPVNSARPSLAGG